MSKKIKISVVVFLIIGLIGFLAYNYIMHGGARDIQSEDAAFTVSSTNLKGEFTSNSDKAIKKYQDKTIQISGNVSSVKDSIVTVDVTILCKMKSLDNAIIVGKPICLKGRFVGFDDLMGELKLDECNKCK